MKESNPKTVPTGRGTLAITLTEDSSKQTKVTGNPVSDFLRLKNKRRVLPAPHRTLFWYGGHGLPHTKVTS